MVSFDWKFKRLIDICGAIVALIIVGPLMAIVAAIVWVSSGSPILFRQRRPGLNGKPFEILKFRTMAQPIGSHGSPKSDVERINRFGRILRRTSIDEFPQFFNVLRGEMSIVGPRPLLMEYLDRYTPDQARRHNVRPGLTGLAQVNGRNATSWVDRMAYDTWYVDNKSLALDVRILAKTVGMVVGRKGVQADEKTIIAPFEG